MLLVCAVTKADRCSLHAALMFGLQIDCACHDVFFVAYVLVNNNCVLGGQAA